MVKKTEEWVSAPRALEILEEVNGRKINPKYLARLGQSEQVRRQAIDGRTYQYNVSDLREARIAEHKKAQKKEETS